MDIDEYTRQLIIQQIDDIESQHNIHVLLAVEEGSRATGLASSDSDYDIRFIYACPVTWYVSVENTLNDEIRIQSKINLHEKETSNKNSNNNSTNNENDENYHRHPVEVDMLGWELRKALRLLRKSNPQLLGWLFSAAVYVNRNESIVEELRQHALQTLDAATLAHNFNRTAHTNWVDYIKNKTQVNRKRYLYIIRSLLSTQHLLLYHQQQEQEQQEQHHQTMPPDHLLTLLSQCGPYIPEDIQEIIHSLVQRKRTTSGAWPSESRIEALDRWIVTTRDENREFAKRLSSERRPDKIEWDALNRIMFKTVLGEI